MPVAADAGAQVLQLGVELGLHLAVDQARFALGAQAAARAFVARALQRELADAHARAVQAGAQAAIAEFKAIDHRAQRQVVGLQRAAQIGRRARAADGHIHAQRAAQPPARRRQQRPHADARQMGAQLAAQRRIDRPEPAVFALRASRARQARFELTVGGACALAVPEQAQRHGVADVFERDAGLFDASGHAGAARRAVGLQRDIAAAARHAGFELERAAQHRVPFGIEDERAAQPRARQFRPGEHFNPADRQAGELASGDEFTRTPAHRLPDQRGL